MAVILAGPSGSDATVYLVLNGATALYGSLTVTAAVPTSKSGQLSLSSVTDEGAATVNGTTYADGDVYSVVATAGSNDTGVTIPIQWRVQGTGYDQIHCVQIERKACR